MAARASAASVVSSALRSHSSSMAALIGLDTGSENVSVMVWSLSVLICRYGRGVARSDGVAKRHDRPNMSRRMRWGGAALVVVLALGIGAYALLSYVRPYL